MDPKSILPQHQLMAERKSGRATGRATPPNDYPEMKLANWFFELLHRLILVGAVSYAALVTKNQILLAVSGAGKLYLFLWLAYWMTYAIETITPMRRLQFELQHFPQALRWTVMLLITGVLWLALGQGLNAAIASLATHPAE